MYRMYSINQTTLAELQKPEIKACIVSPFCTFEWLSFLEKNQNVSPVVLSIKDNDVEVALFVGAIIKKAFIKILGSPFEGWLTPDMGFIPVQEYDINNAILAIRDYAFNQLGCAFLQISDKKIKKEVVHVKGAYFEESRILYIDSSKSPNEILEGFTKNGRRDVRASGRKGLEFRRMEFDKNFADIYYEQLIDVFEKQNLKPNYDLKKVYDLVDAMKEVPERVFAVGAFFENKCVGTVFSFGFGKWAYYIGAASFRQYQKMLPNEGLFWEFVKYWHEQGIENIDMVGFREYKLKYNPEIIMTPTIIFQKYPLLLQGKHFAKKQWNALEN